MVVVVAVTVTKITVAVVEPKVTMVVVKENIKVCGLNTDGGSGLCSVGEED